MARAGSADVYVSGVVCIDISNQGKVGVAFPSIHDPKIQCSLDVPQDVHQGNPVGSFWVQSKFFDCGDGIGKIRLSCYFGIHDGTQNFCVGLVSHELAIFVCYRGLLFCKWGPKGDWCWCRIAVSHPELFEDTLEVCGVMHTS